MSVVVGVALVTGSAQGIGRGIALRLASDGFDIALNDVSSKRDQLRAVADDIEKLGRKALLVPADVSVEEEVKRMVQEVAGKLGGLDVVVANAAILEMAPLISMGLDQWERVMAVNARGPFLCYKYAAQQMIKQGRGGRIIGATSVAGKIGGTHLAAYASSKFAIRGLTQTAAIELGRYDITVNTFAAGLIKTPMSSFIFDGEQVPSQEGAGFPRHGQPEDIASIVSYLVSKEAHFITGQCITVDGGISLSSVES